MQYKITIDLPNLSKGQGVAIIGLGEFENGKSYVIDEETQDQFRAVNATQVDEEDDKGRPTGRVLSNLGPTLKQAKFQEGITVEAVKEEKKADESPKDDKAVKEGDK
jgi:hypothetical protein